MLKSSSSDPNNLPKAIKYFVKTSIFLVTYLRLLIYTRLMSYNFVLSVAIFNYTDHVLFTRNKLPIVSTSFPRPYLYLHKFWNLFSHICFYYLLYFMLILLFLFSLLGSLLAEVLFKVLLLPSLWLSHSFLYKWCTAVETFKINKTLFLQEYWLALFNKQ